MTSRREHPTNSTGASPAHPVNRLTDRECDEPYLDGLFTYCLSVMCEHEAAVAALGEALALAHRQRGRGRAPQDPEARRPWLYALARWACSRRLAEQKDRERELVADRRGGTREGERGPGPQQKRGGGAFPAAPASPAAAQAGAYTLSETARSQRRRELSALAWPEAAGTAPAQREALELSVRHGLPEREVAAVLSLTPGAAGDLLAHAACEVERTRAALTVVETGGCPAVSRLSGDDRLLLGTALRRELVRHVDECPRCRRAAERTMAGVTWPGTAPATAALPVLEAPRPAVHGAAALARGARAQRAPRFDRGGFPLEDKDRTARRARLRSKAVTTTVVATVLAAPVLTLWAAYRGAPVTGEPQADRSVAEPKGDGKQEYDGLDGHPYEHAGHPRPYPKKSSTGGRSHRSGVGVEVERLSAGAKGPGRLTVAAEPLGNGSLVTLTATGGSPLRWSADSDAPWLVLSRTGGVLRPGESAALRVAVDRTSAPAGSWTAHVRIAPARAVITLTGNRAPRPTRTSPPAPPSSPAPTSPPTTSTPPDPTPTPTPTDSEPPRPTPTPTPS